MSKVRVYELANELKIDNKELVDRLKAGGMSVKNHMSTLDDSDIRRAKEIISAGSVSEVIEEKRLQRNVIRRRKVVQVEETEKIEETMKAEPSPEKEPEVVTPVKEAPARIIKKVSAPEPEKKDKEAAIHAAKDIAITEDLKNLRQLLRKKLKSKRRSM
jgi:translation initiation factor IF-2